MAIAVAAVPGLLEFFDAMEGWDLDPDDAMLIVIRTTAEHQGRLL
jgi:hypothetical protein